MQENTTSNSAPKERRKARKNRSGAHSIGSNIAYLLKNIARRYPALLFMMAVEIAAGVAAPAFGIYLPKLAADLGECADISAMLDQRMQDIKDHIETDATSAARWDG